jgi:hypothetical protein
LLAYRRAYRRKCWSERALHKALVALAATKDVESALSKGLHNDRQGPYNLEEPVANSLSRKPMEQFVVVKVVVVIFPVK